MLNVKALVFKPATLRRSQAEDNGMRVRVREVLRREISRCEKLDKDGLPSFCMQERVLSAMLGSISR
jgi:hypothetical protein